MGRFVDLTDRVFGRLTVLERAPNRRSKTMWRCRCLCGTVTDVGSSDLRGGSQKSCGCLRTERARNLVRKHGLSKTPLYLVWVSLRQRCQNPANKGYANYGGRGIKVCAEWQDFDAFRNWARANGYRAGLSIDRIDNDGNYEPSNCRWTTATQQARNKRANRRIRFRGRSRTLGEWAEELGVPMDRLRWRLRVGWSVEDAFTIPKGGAR